MQSFPRALRRSAALIAGLALAAALYAAGSLPAQAATVDYTPSNADIANPERGFYHHTGDCDRDDFDLQTLRNYRTQQQITLVMCVFYLSGFQDAPISQAALDQFQEQADTVREAGLKMVLRFAYTDSGIGDDAPLSQVEQHLDQLAPYLDANADVIHIMQAGFIGAWGEWYYTQHFGNEGNVSEADWANRRAVVDKILEVLPPDRMVQLRTPNFKRTMYDPAPLDPSRAYDGTALARTGHHNDCFLAGPDDFGTYIDIPVEYPYLSAETRYTGMGGETCNPDPPRSQCPTALEEMELFHYNYLNIDYRAEVLDGWTGGGCMDEVRRSLGHRFALTDGEYPDSAPAGGALPIRITVENHGWSAPFNPRDAVLILRDVATGEVHERPLRADPRFWNAGEAVVVEETVALDGIPAGDYRLLLHLPDPDLDDRPEYAIQLANQGVWEPGTGYNDLLHTVTIG